MTIVTSSQIIPTPTPSFLPFPDRYDSLPRTPGPNHPILHRQPLAPLRLCPSQLLLPGLPQRPQERHLLVHPAIVRRLGRFPPLALRGEQVIETLLLPDRAGAVRPLRAEQCAQDLRRVVGGDDESAQVRTERDGGAEMGGEAENRVDRALAGETEIEVGEEGLNTGRVLAGVEEVLQAGLVMGVPFVEIDVVDLGASGRWAWALTGSGRSRARRVIAGGLSPGQDGGAIAFGLQGHGFWEG